MSLSLKAKHLSHMVFLARTRRFREVYNYVWVRNLWWSPFWQKMFLLRLGRLYDIYPPFLEIEPTTVCNFKCVICEHTYWDEKPRNMSFEEFKSIVDQFPRLKWLGLTGIGSSFLNKDFMRMVKYTKSKGTILELVDTLNHVDEDTIGELLDVGVNILFVSFYGASKESYEQICVGSDFNKVVENLRCLVRMKKERKTQLPVLNFHFIVNRSNIHEMTVFLELIHSLDAGEYEVLFTPLLHGFNEVKDLTVELTDETMEVVKERGKELGINVAYNLNVPTNKPPVSDCALWIMPFVFVTGHVIPCCVGNEANRREFQKETSLGNVFEHSFRDIWYGDKYKNFRRMIRRGDVPIQCKNCSDFDTRCAHVRKC